MPRLKSRNADPKRAVLRRADTERETAYSTGGETHLAKKKPITLPHVSILDKPLPDDEDDYA
jgi:hypothetical protein